MGASVGFIRFPICKMIQSLLIVSTIRRRDAMREAVAAQELFIRCGWCGSGKRMDKKIGATLSSRHMKWPDGGSIVRSVS